MSVKTSEPDRYFDQIWLDHASRMMCHRGDHSIKAASAALALLRLIYGGQPDFEDWDAKRASSRGHAAKQSALPAYTELNSVR